MECLLILESLFGVKLTMKMNIMDMPMAMHDDFHSGERGGGDEQL